MITARAVSLAYVNHGKWIADCSRQDCYNAMRLEPKQTHIHCGGEGGCQLISDVVWPTDAEAITRVLSARPVPTTRNWAPAGHRQSLAVGLPEGQTVADLIAENIEHGEMVDV